MQVGNGSGDIGNITGCRDVKPRFNLPFASTRHSPQNNNPTHRTQYFVTGSAKGAAFHGARLDREVLDFGEERYSLAGAINNKT